MRIFHVFVTMLCGGCVGALAVDPAELVVHEWGTFTTMAGSDGIALSGLHLEEEALPPFVYRQHFGAGKGLNRVTGATVKMETPVLYFYAEQQTPVQVRVDFSGGSISEWFPQRSEGEPLTPMLNLTQPYRGRIAWNIDVLAPDTDGRPSPDPRLVSPLWEAPRRTSANLIRGESGEIEHYLFYRGVGNFETPVQTRYDDSARLHVKNMGTEPIPFAFLYERDAGDQARIEWLGHLAPGEDRMTGDIHLDGSMKAIEPRLRATFVHALTEEGLFGDEAEAMIETWWRSYFQKPGLRVFWIVPRTFTDTILPIEIDPAPTDLVRVMVGRSEILSPAFEHELVETIGTTVNPHVADRFAPAYQARVQALRTAP